MTAAAASNEAEWKPMKETVKSQINWHNRDVGLAKTQS